MKNNLIKILLVSYFLLIDFAVFCQGDEDDNGDLEGNDPPAVPVNGKIIFLILIGIFFAFHILRKKKSKLN